MRIKCFVNNISFGKRESKKGLKMYVLYVIASGQFVYNFKLTTPYI